MSRAGLLLLLFPLLSSSIDNYSEKGWRMAAEYLAEYMDKTVSPCSNVADFMCGNFGNASSDDYQSYRNVKTSKLIESFGEAVEGVRLNETTPSYTRLIRKFFDECTATPDDDPSTIREIHSVLAEAIGEFPPFDEDVTNTARNTTSTNVDEDNRWYLLGRMRRLLGQSLGIVTNFGSTCTIWMDKVSDVFPLEYFRNKTLQVAAALNETVDGEHLETTLNEAKGLYDDWAANGTISGLTNSENTVQANNRNLTTLVPTIDWDSYFRGYFPQEYYEKWKNGQLFEISVETPPLMRNIGEIFGRHSQRAVRMLMYGKAFQTLAKEYIRNVERFQSELLTSDESVPSSDEKTVRRQQCLTYMMDRMPAASARVLFDHMGVDVIRYRSQISLMATNVFSAMRLLLNGVSYLSPLSKERINRKLDRIHLQPAIPDWITNETRVLQNEAGYNASRSLFMSYVIEKREEFARTLGQFVKRSSTIVTSRSGARARTPTAVKPDEPPPTFEQNSMYNWNQNLISILLGYILPPTFSLDYPLAVKYGRMGALIGHELTHAFDSKDSLIGSESGGEKLLQSDEEGIFERQQKCLVQQYSQTCFAKLGRCLTGRTAIRDNIADIGGLKVAYAAYRFARDLLPEDEPPLPGLEEYTHDQLFFMTYQRWFCSRNTPSQDWLANSHTPDTVRGPVALKNNPHFAASFQCHVGSESAPMRPCEMWGDIMEE